MGNDNSNVGVRFIVEMFFTEGIKTKKIPINSVKNIAVIDKFKSKQNRTFFDNTKSSRYIYSGKNKYLN